MLLPRRLFAAALATVFAVGAAGCSAVSDAPRTVIVTETGSTDSSSTDSSSTDSSAAGATDTGSVTAPPLTGPSETASDSSSASSTSESASPSSETPTSTAAPFKSIDPLKVDCARILTPAKLAEIYGGGLPGGTNRITEAANDERGIVGRVKCQYGVSADKTVIAVTVIFAQFTGADSSKSQIAITVQDEKDRGARASTTDVQGYPADILLREGGLLVMNYDTWSLSVVIANGVLDEGKLPDALKASADFALTQAIA